MINDWTEENAVLLAEWCADEYKFEEMGMVESVLKNPPVKKDYRGEDQPTWKLNPDTVRRWMSEAMDRQAANREAEHQRLKSSFNDPLPVPIKNDGEQYAEFYKQFYGGFINRLEDGTALREVKSDPWLKGSDEYNKFRAQRLIKQKPTETKNQEGNE